MKVGEGADHVRLFLQDETSLDLCCLEVIERVEGAIGYAFVGERPQPFTGLQFGRIGRQEG